MDKNNVCPVCGKSGIPDYHESDIVCPQCGSDLSIYRVINQITEIQKNIWKPISVAAILAATVMGVFLFFNKLDTTSDLNSIADQKQLQDSISVLNIKIGALASQEKTAPSGYNYIVRKGDSFWTISQKVYGTGNRYNEIAESNNMISNDALHVGDTLIIK